MKKKETERFIIFDHAMGIIMGVVVSVLCAYSAIMQPQYWEIAAFMWIFGMVIACGMYTNTLD